MARSNSYLTYVIATQVLKGKVCGQEFDVNAVSGGGRGSTVVGTAQYSLGSFDPRKPTFGLNANERGGVIPPGHWWIFPPKWKDNKHPKLGRWVAFLKPIGDQLKHFPKRKYDEARGFFIHGPGEHGSDGCLVVPKEPREKLLSAIEANKGVVLKVVLNDIYYSPQKLLQEIKNENWRNV